jgi:GT2 family glycosyltransferase
MSSKPSLRIIIVNWNAGAQLRDCLYSICGASQKGFILECVVVVDNGSVDGSADCVKDINLNIRLIRNSRNRGFAAACNQGVEHSETDYLLFLNPDMTLHPDSLEVPIAFMSNPENSGTGICGIQLLGGDGRISRSCSRFPTTGMFIARSLGLDRLFPSHFRQQFMTEWNHAESALVDQVIGAFFLVRRSVYEALGGFDERFFVYFEEVDFSLRARNAGWGCHYLTQAVAYHRGCGTSDQAKGDRLFYSLRSRMLYGYKHFGKASATVLACSSLLWEPISRLTSALINGSPGLAMETLKGYGRLWRSVLSVLRRKICRV